MKIREIEVQLSLPGSKVPRSEGIHVSSIIRCIATELGILKGNIAEDLSLTDVREITDPVAILRISIGLAWEQYYIPEILGPSLDVIDHPGEMEVDGIYMTHDGESLSVIITDTTQFWGLMVHEIKATYKSVKTVGDMSTQWMWLTQCKAYCKGKGTRFAMMHVLFLCGDYKFPITPQLKCWQIEFTQDEIDENWELMTDYVKHKQGEK
jgi:hypothetical protein